MKDRRSFSAYVIALEAVVVPLARRALAGMTQQERADFAQAAADCAVQAGKELVDGAAIMRHGSALTPQQAKATAQKIADDAGHTVTEFLLELMPPPDERK